MLLIGSFFYCVASAVIPIFNAEAYLAGVGVGLDDAGVWRLAAAAAAGQMVGKVGFFFVGREAMRWKWFRQKVESARWAAAVERWSTRRTSGKVGTAAIIFISAAVGVPPFAITAVIAGQLRVSLAEFIALGFVGRLLRFATILGLLDYAL